MHIQEEDKEIQELKIKLEKLENDQKVSVKMCQACYKIGHETKECWHLRNFRQQHMPRIRINFQRNIRYRQIRPNIRTNRLRINQIPYGQYKQQFSNTQHFVRGQRGNEKRFPRLQYKG